MKQQIWGLTGGTGCGKTTALRVLQRMGFHIIDCDALYHRLLQTDRAMLQAIDRAFPGTVADNTLQRKVLGQRVFSDPAALDTLNRTVWPYITAAVEAELRDRAPQPCAIDAVALLESGLAGLCTKTVAITAPEALRVQRLLSRDGITEEYARLRIRAQQPNEAFSSTCDLTVENHFRTAEAFAAHCETIFSTILKEEPQS